MGVILSLRDSNRNHVQEQREQRERMERQQLYYSNNNNNNIHHKNGYMLNTHTATINGQSQVLFFVFVAY